MSLGQNKAKEVSGIFIGKEVPKKKSIQKKSR